MTKNNMREIVEKINSAFKSNKSMDDIISLFEEAHEEAIKDEEYAAQCKAYEEMIESVEPFYNETLEQLKIAEDNLYLKNEPCYAIEVKFYKTILADIRKQLYKNKPNLFDYIDKALKD